MKVPAECPGEQTKEDKKRLKGERQEAANVLKGPSTGHNDNAAELPTMSRSNTMNSLSSGYAASANRSVSGGARSPADENTPERPNATGLSTLRKSRVAAPPPASYVSELPPSSVNGSSANEQRGKMLYAYEARGHGEITLAEGKEVTILEPDGELHIKYFAGNTNRP
jgi:hypothetical protein